MNNWKARLLTPLLVTSFCFAQAQAQSEWSQWGGPRRDFTTNSKGLAATWPATGPRQLWSRPLGAGHSAVLVGGNTLYTMYSTGEEETVIALAADTGKTIWEHKYASPHSGLDYEFGAGPHATPLLVGDLLFTVGSRGVVHALNTKSG
ncbi:MAG TPA: PQQ-binding-like beta-propeller repeat protein, partial [Pyrinomonadaceae bacterium]|nr:PQQ-binding-like beta-propeller repeat protein [Pyrinomonadaceae bacterium]